MGLMVTCSKHFTMMGVSASGQWSLQQEGDGFFGNGIMVVALRHVETLGSARC